MRTIILAALMAACDSAARRPAGTLPGPGIEIEGSTGDAPRLDLGTDPPIPDLPPETGDSSGTGGSTTGEGSTGGSSTGSSSSTSEATSTTGGDSSSGSSSGDTSSSSGEPPPAECGDGVCEPSERAPCWAPGWCLGDCYKEPECASDCPCTPAAAAVKNWCYADPLPACAATAPGGYCDPNGDGLPDDADDIQGFYSWYAKCG